MKNLFFIMMLFFLAFLSCRNDESGVQKIDQIINLYIDSAGQDMLNNKIEGSYTNIQLNDVYGITDNSPVTYSNRKDADTINYLEYIAGAKRITIDSTADSKIYESKIALALTKKINDSTTAVSNDTMTVQYFSTPDLFQVSKIYYNNLLKFTKVEDEPNIVKITK